MSQENVELARAGYAALKAQDLERFLLGVDENVEIHEIPGVPGRDVYRGHDGFREWYATGSEVIDDFAFEIEEIRDLGDTVFARVRAHGTGRIGGVPFEQRLFHVLDYRDGNAWRIRGFLDEREAFAAAGLTD